MNSNIEKKMPNYNSLTSTNSPLFYYIALLPEAVVIQKDDRIIYFNNSFISLVNIQDENQLMGQKFYDIFRIHKEDLHPIDSNKLLDTEIKSIEIENFYGSLLHVEIKSTLKRGTYFNEEVITIVDITQKQKMIKDFAESKIRHEKLLGILPDAICIHNNDTYSFVNENFTKMFGYENPEEVIGMKIRNIITPENPETWDSRVNEILTLNEFLSPFVLKCRNKSGGEIYIESNSTKLLYNNEINILSVLRDITYKVIYEDLQRKIVQEEMLRQKTIEYEKLKTDFLSNISHELRTPLNILLSSLQLLNIYTNNMETKEILNIKTYLRLMKQNCYRLLRLTNNFIDITKMETGFYELNSKNINIVSAVEDITLSVVEYMKNKNIDIIFDTEVEEKIISCDEDKLERIILNLLSNAIKFTPPGGKIEVNIYDRAPFVIISIKDTGMGIPEDKLKVIFDRYSQVDNILTREHQGSGIGLSLVKSLVELHGGKIEVNSIYGQGTEFLIYFPITGDEHFYQLQMDLPKDYESVINSNIEKMNIEFSDIYLV